MKKGFTLVELLAVIIIVSLIAMLAITNIVKKSNEMKEISNKKVEQLVVSSAKSYFYNNYDFRTNVKNTGKGVVEYTTLINNNYLADNLKNITTYENIDINNSCVCITYNKNNDGKYLFNISQPCNCN